MRRGLDAVLLALLFATPPSPAPPPETYHLDISEKRIHRPALEAGSALRVESDDRGVRVNVGASITADGVDIRLRNVKGTVRFRADTRRLQPSPQPSPDPGQQ